MYSFSSSLNYSGRIPKNVNNSVPALIAKEYGYPVNCGSVDHLMDHIIKTRYRNAGELFSKDLYSHYGCVNAIEFSNNGQLMVSGGDDRRVLLWNVEKALSGKGQPRAMKAEHTSNIFCLGFDSCNRHLFSGGNDEQVIIHDAETGEPLKVITHREAIYCLSVDPQNDNLFATACDEGRIFLFDMRESYHMDNLPVLIHTRSAFHAVMHNPVEPRLIVTANSREGISLWDIRKPRVNLIKYNGGLVPSQSAMSVRFNSRGTQILALRRRLPPILYNIASPHPIAEFDHKGYYNSCTMKSCSFAGRDDEYILSGSDDFKLYMWRIPDDLMEHDLMTDGIKWIGQTHLVLRGHRSIVNQVRYNYANSIIASSGVEKVIKIWSPFDIFNEYPDDETRNVVTAAKANRKVYSHEEYIQLVLESGQLAAHDYSHQSVQEDARMMAFFDSLVQRDIEGWTSDSSGEESSDFPKINFKAIIPNKSRSIMSQNASQSDLSSSDNETEPLNILNSQTVSYIQSFSERMEASANQLCAEDTTVPTMNRPSTSSQAFTDTRPIDESQYIHSDTNKISLLINDKKKDQLRKVARCALRSTRLRLRKLQKALAREKERGEKETANSKASDLMGKIQLKDQLEDVLVILERLSQKVDTGCKNGRKNFHKMRTRLRYLTDRSDFILNEEVPMNSDSDSDDDGGRLMNGNGLIMMNHELARVANLLSNNAGGDDSDDDSSVGNRSLSSMASSDSDDNRFSSCDSSISRDEMNGDSSTDDSVNESDGDDDQNSDEDANDDEDEDEESRPEKRHRKATKRKTNIISPELVDTDDSHSSSEKSVGWTVPPNIRLYLQDDESDGEGSLVDRQSATVETISNGENVVQSNSRSSSPQPSNACHKSPGISDMPNTMIDSSHSNQVNSTGANQCDSGTSSSLVNFKSVNNSGRCYRKRKVLEETDSSNEHSKQIKKNHQNSN